jgi:CRP-like cAMP-binding protein
VLDTDPELASCVPLVHREAARRALVGQLEHIAPGGWVPPARSQGAFGLLVAKGVLLRRVHVRGAKAVEIVGSGDLLRPWEDELEGGVLPVYSTWEVLEQASLITLDGAFTAAAGLWPELIVTLGSRLLRRARRLSVAVAISGLPRVDDRLLALLWLLADVWGRVTPAGVLVPIRLTHETLAEAVGARRPTVTRAITGLRQLGLISRSGRHYLLHGPPGGPFEP